MEFDDSLKETNDGCPECDGQGCSNCHPEQTPEELHGIETEGHEPEETEEFLRRAKVVYNQMFEEHSKCPPSACPGHGLPPMASKFLAKLKYPTDAVHSAQHVRMHYRLRAHTHTCTNVCCLSHAQVQLYLSAKKWFARIDVDNGGTLSEAEVRGEFERMGIHPDEATNIMKFAAGETAGSVLQRWTSKVQRASSYMSSSGVTSAVSAESRELSLDHFVKVIVYVLDNSIDNLTAADVCTLGALLHEYDADGNGLMDFEEFANIALDLVRTSFVFNGPESLGTMHLHQLDTLRLHQWKSREPEEGKEGDNRENALAGKQDTFNTDAPVEEEEPEPFVPLYTLKAQETEELIRICDTIQKLSEPYADLRERAKNLHDGRDLAFVEDKGSHIVALVSALTVRLKRDIRKDWTGDTTLAAAYRKSDELRAVSVEAEKLKDIFKKQGKC